MQEYGEESILTKTKERFSIKFEKTWLGTRTMIINNKVDFFIMRGQAWGFGIELDPLDRSFTIHFLNIFAGVTVYHE